MLCLFTHRASCVSARQSLTRLLPRLCSSSSNLQTMYKINGTCPLRLTVSLDEKYFVLINFPIVNFGVMAQQWATRSFGISGIVATPWRSTLVLEGLLFCYCYVIYDIFWVYQANYYNKNCRKQRFRQMLRKAQCRGHCICKDRQSPQARLTWRVSAAYRSAAMISLS